MGSPSAIISMGFGSWGSVGEVVTLGYGSGAFSTLIGVWSQVIHVHGNQDRVITHGNAQRVNIAGNQDRVHI